MNTKMLLFWLFTINPYRSSYSRFFEHRTTVQCCRPLPEIIRHAVTNITGNYIQQSPSSNHTVAHPNAGSLPLTHAFLSN